MKLKDKEKTIGDLTKALAEAQRKAERGQQLQGEIVEEDLENFLKGNFMDDEILPVPKGVKGADVLQKVFLTRLSSPDGIFRYNF